MSSVSKGGEWQKEISRLWSRKGYKPLIAKRVYGLSQDFWGCWDLILVNDFERVMFVQVSCWSAKSSKIKQVLPFPKNIAHCECVIALRMRAGESSDYPPPHFRILRLEDNYVWKGETWPVVK